MKKINKICSLLCLMLIVMVTVVSSIGNVAAAPKSTTISKVGAMQSYIGEHNKWAMFQTSDDKVAYCMDVTKKWPEVSTNMAYAGEADAGVKYILENGYPYKNFTGNSAYDRFITQAAIWWYLAETQGSTLSDDFVNGEDLFQIRQYVIGLKDAAKNAKNSSSNVSVDVAISSTNMNLSSDKKEYVSSEITANVSGASTFKVEISGASGATATSLDGTAKSEFSAGEKFLIKIPANSIGRTSNISVKVSASTSVKKAYIFKPGDDSYQRVAALYDESVSADKTITLTAKVDKDKVCVDYVIVGNVIPDPNLTDPTPGKNCYDKGTKYTQEKELTTRQSKCTFKGWFTNENLTGKWKDGTALNKDQTLYGAWDCEEGSVINVPSTAANTSIIILAVGLVAIAGGLGVYYFRNKNIKANK